MNKLFRYFRLDLKKKLKHLYFNKLDLYKSTYFEKKFLVLDDLKHFLNEKSITYIFNIQRYNVSLNDNRTKK